LIYRVRSNTYKMAVEIKEMVIRATIVADKQGEQPSVPVTADQNEIIKECVKEVLRIIKKNNRR
jgi:hypothetical protein